MSEQMLGSEEKVYWDKNANCSFLLFWQKKSTHFSGLGGGEAEYLI